MRCSWLLNECSEKRSPEKSNSLTEPLRTVQLRAEHRLVVEAQRLAHRRGHRPGRGEGGHRAASEPPPSTSLRDRRLGASAEDRPVLEHRLSGRQLELAARPAPGGAAVDPVVEP